MRTIESPVGYSGKLLSPLVQALCKGYTKISPRISHDTIKSIGVGAVGPFVGTLRSLAGYSIDTIQSVGLAVMVVSRYYI